MAGLDPTTTTLANAADIVSGLPSFIQDLIDPSKLEGIWLVPLSVTTIDDQTTASSGILLDEPLTLSVPGVDAISLVLGAAGDATIFPSRCRSFRRCSSQSTSASRSGSAARISSLSFRTRRTGRFRRIRHGRRWTSRLEP